MDQPEVPHLGPGLPTDPKKWPSFFVVLAAKAGTQEGWQAFVEFCRPLIVRYAQGSCPVPEIFNWEMG